MTSSHRQGRPGRDRWTFPRPLADRFSGGGFGPKPDPETTVKISVKVTNSASTHRVVVRILADAPEETIRTLLTIDRFRRRNPELVANGDSGHAPTHGNIMSHRGSRITTTTGIRKPTIEPLARKPEADASSRRSTQSNSRQDLT